MFFKPRIARMNTNAWRDNSLRMDSCNSCSLVVKNNARNNKTLVATQGNTPPYRLKSSSQTQGLPYT